MRIILQHLRSLAYRHISAMPFPLQFLSLHTTPELFDYLITTLRLLPACPRQEGNGGHQHP